MKKFNLIFSLIVIFFMLGKVSFVYAESFQAYISTDKVNLRENPTTKNSNILGSLSTGNQITIVDSNKISGDGCSDGWYSISYNDLKGYVCSTYVTMALEKDEYLRPWNTPYKAIVGGAIYISNGYISRGQYNSYLKKYNVNPNSYYAMYNHQYQTNIVAPASEAYTSWKAYDKAGYMKSGSESFPFIFTIPVYNNMADSYKVEGLTGANLSTSEETDEAFEEMIKDFPESYKPYLRDLHKEHPNWTFKALITGVDFEAAAAIERNVGAVQKEVARYKDENGNYIQTEAGWYKPTLEATEFYMDPRNWLNETYIFMFEDLSYSDSVSEDVVKSILSNKGLLDEYDIIDNMTYSAIFMEAGKKANVSPVYLASLSMQEIGSRNISGAEFEYDGVVYSGLFNFYNLGAYSSASNPTSAGLVFASGGVCTICANYSSGDNTDDNKTDGTEEKKEEQQEEEKKEEPVVVYGNIANVGIAFGNFVKGFNVGEAISALQTKDANISYDSLDLIKTGTILNTGLTSYIAVIYGDLDGDGIIDSADLLRMRRYLLGKTTLEGAYLEAAKVTGDTIDSASLLKIRRYLLGKDTINQG